MAGKKQDLRQALEKSSLLTADQIKTALDESRKSGDSLIRVILKNKLLDEKILLKFLEEEMDIPHVTLSTYVVDQRIIESIPPATAEKYGVVPLFLVENTLAIAMIDPFDIKAIDEIRSKSKYDVQILAATPSDVESAITQ